MPPELVNTLLTYPAGPVKIAYSIFFCDEERTKSSFQCIRDVIEGRGLFCSLYTDRGSHYWITPKADVKVASESDLVWAGYGTGTTVDLVLSREKLSGASIALAKSLIATT